MSARNIPKTIFSILQSRSCHGAIRFGDPLDRSQITDLVRTLATCQVGQGGSSFQLAQSGKHDTPPHRNDLIVTRMFLLSCSCRSSVRTAGPSWFPWLPLHPREQKWHKTSLSDHCTFYDCQKTLYLFTNLYLLCSVVFTVVGILDLLGWCPTSDRLHHPTLQCLPL